jgi:hypothetical protein
MAAAVETRHSSKLPASLRLCLVLCLLSPCGLMAANEEALKADAEQFFRDYPGIATDYQRTFQRLKSLHCDIFLGAHGDYYGLEAKFPRLGSEGPNIFVDPRGYDNYVSGKEAAFLKELERQRKGTF